MPSSAVGRNRCPVSSSVSRAQPSAGDSPGSRCPAGLLSFSPSTVSSSTRRKRPSRSMMAATVTLGFQRMSMRRIIGTLGVYGHPRRFPDRRLPGAPALRHNARSAHTCAFMNSFHSMSMRILLASLVVVSVLAGPARAQSAGPSTSPAAPAASARPAVPGPALLPAVVPPLVAIQPPSAAVNPYGLRALWAQGDWVAQGTLAILAIMSLASWYVLITKLLAQARMGGQGKAANKSFWSADSVRQGMESLQKTSPYRYIAESALEATNKHDGLIGQVDLNTWVAQSIERAVGTVHSRTQEGLAVLATVGSTAPFVGLFGTVWGIYNALVRI